jgi:hypothetical protein
MNFTQLRDEVISAIDAKIAVQLRSRPGRGKSEFIEALVAYLSERDGEEWGFSVAFLATYTPPDLVGYQFKGERTWDGQSFTVTDASMPLWMLTRTGKPVFHYKRGILFLDEYGQGEADVKRASAELLLNRRLGPWVLPDGWCVIAASNGDKDRSGVTKEFDFVINRRLEIEITDDVGAWTDYAMRKGVMPLTIAFANQNTHIVFADKPDQQGPWCTPRSLVMADRLLRLKAERLGSVPEDPTTIETVSGLIGAGAAAQLFAFVKLERDMPKYEYIVANPEKASVPTKPDAQMLVCYNLAHRVSMEEADKVMTYIQRLPAEFATTFVKSACQRNHNFVSLPSFHKWAHTNSSLMASIALGRK